MNLYNAVTEYDEILSDLLERLESKEIDEVTFSDTLESVQGDLNEKLLSFAASAKNAEAKAEYIKAAEKELADKRKSEERKAEKIRQIIKDTMNRFELFKISNNLIQVSRRNNPPSVDVYDADSIPEQFWRTKTERSIDKQMLKYELLDREIFGAQIVQTESLVIK